MSMTFVLFGFRVRMPAVNQVPVDEVVKTKILTVYGREIRVSHRQAPVRLPEAPTGVPAVPSTAIQESSST